MSERPDDTHPMSNPDPAPRALNAWPKSIQEKIETLAARQAALYAEVHRAQSDEAMSRARLGEALMRAMAARCDAERQAREAALAHWRAQGARLVRPARRNRPRRLAEKIAVRLGAGATVIAASGLWLAGGRQFSEISTYVRRGADPAARPAALFDQAYYLARNPDVAASGASPLLHYLLGGGRELRDPHPLFDARYYVERNGVDLGLTGLTPLEHYLRLGAFQGLDPHPLFKTAYYLVQAPDVFETGETPLVHFLRVGASLGLSPTPLFDLTFYVNQAGSEAPANPLLHFLAEGSARGLKPHALFDPAWFTANHPQCGGAEALTYYALHGGSGTLSPGPWLDGPDYAARRSGLNGVDPLSDYLDGGAWTVGEPSPGFFTAAFLASHPELAEQGVTPLEFYAARGRA